MAFFLLFCVLSLCIAAIQSASVKPTKTNSTGVYYISGTITTFRDKQITCASSSPNCFIRCRGKIKCQNTIVDASLADFLSISCSAESACQSLTIIAAPKTKAEIFCTGKKACAESTFGLETTKVVSLNCSMSITDSMGMYAAPCFNTMLQASNATQVNVQCDQYNCMSPKFNVSSAKKATFIMHESYQTIIEAIHVSESLNVECIGASSCSATFIECPINAACNIRCSNADTSSCNSVAIKVPDSDYSNLYLNCESKSACLETMFQCSQTNAFTRLTWTDGRYRCSIITELDNCCPQFEIPSQTIICEPGKQCDIYCNATNKCADALIDGREANTLNIYCDGYKNCNSAEIYCPNITSQGVCHVECNSELACFNMFVGLFDHLNTLNISCNDKRACYLMQIYPANTEENNMYLNDWLSIHNVYLECNDRKSCESLNFELTHGVLGAMYVSCNDDMSCYKAELINIEVMDAFFMNCDGLHSCESTKVALIGRDGAENVIHCRGTNVSKFDMLFSCYQASFLLGSANETGTVSAYLICGAFACRESTVRVYEEYPIQLLNIECQTSGCYDMDILAQNAASLHLNCRQKDACSAVGIHCPVSNENACNVQCLSGDRVCVSMVFWSPYNYTQNAISLSCIAPDQFYLPCFDLNFACSTRTDTRYYERLTSSITYDKESKQYEKCVGYNNITYKDDANVCCPVSVVTKHNVDTTLKPIPTVEKATDSDKAKSATWVIIGVCAVVLLIVCVAGWLYLKRSKHHTELLLAMQDDPYRPPTKA